MRNQKVWKFEREAKMADFFLASAQTFKLTSRPVLTLLSAPKSSEASSDVRHCPAATTVARLERVKGEKSAPTKGLHGANDQPPLVFFFIVIVSFFCNSSLFSATRVQTPLVFVIHLPCRPACCLATPFLKEEKKKRAKTPRKGEEKRKEK